MKPFACFAAAGRWLRGNCHTHTTLSDGSRDPAATVEGYRKAGYDFLVLSDHSRRHGEPEGLGAADFLVIGGVELHCPPRFRGNSHHLLAVGVDAVPDKRSARTARSLIRWVHKRGGLCYYAHPYWTGHEPAHMLEGAEAMGVEVFNSVCETTRGLGHSHVHWDQMLSRGLRWQGIAVDDTHNWRDEAFGGSIMVKARRLTRRAVLDAMRKGWFYATQGPRILHLGVRRGVFTLECSPAKAVGWYGPGPTGRVQHAGGKPITRSEFKPVSANMAYLRVEVIADDGKKAWSNPVWRDPRTGAWRG